jgi:hypothetical protein
VLVVLERRLMQQVLMEAIPYFLLSLLRAVVEVVQDLMVKLENQKMEKQVVQVVAVEVV